MNFEPYINLQNIFSFSELTFVENMTMVQEVPQKEFGNPDSFVFNN